MGKNLSSIIPEPETLLALEPEELAGVVIEYLNSIPSHERRSLINRQRFCSEDGVMGYPTNTHEDIRRALMEAWIWLEREGLIAPSPGQLGGESYFITRRGQRIQNTNDLEAFRKANLLPKQLLHPVIAQKCWSAFVRGDYDTAVFQAFKEVEVAVRSACGYPQTDYGVNLMRKAFDKSYGPLTDQSLPEAEREAMAHLFAGAIGLYKNPHSHRNVSITDPAEAVGLIVFASHLLQIVDVRAIKP